MTAYEKAHKNALDVQNGCNFSGVLKSFARDMEAVREHMHATGTYGSHAFAMHPVALMYMDKLADLQGRPDAGTLPYAMSQIADVIVGPCKS
jgi:hypothetical protein